MSPLPSFTGTEIRQVEKATIEKFLKDRRQLIRGDVLDFGCGTADTCREPMPYKGLVEACGARYVGYDPGLGHNVDVFLRGPYDTIICTQVIQYIVEPVALLSRLRWAIRAGGYLLMTYPTVWTETIEENDYFRYTAKGMAMLLARSGWNVIEDVARGKIDIPDWPIFLGHGVIARCEE